MSFVLIKGTSLEGTVSKSVNLTLTLAPKLLLPACSLSDLFLTKKPEHFRPSFLRDLRDGSSVQAAAHVADPFFLVNLNSCEALWERVAGP